MVSADSINDCSGRSPSVEASSPPLAQAAAANASALAAASAGSVRKQLSVMGCTSGMSFSMCGAAESAARLRCVVTTIVFRISGSRIAAPARREERGEALALLVVWPALIVAILVMLVHVFIVTNAQAEAELAASQGLRSAWRVAADSDFLDDPTNPGPDDLYGAREPHPEVLAMADAAKDAVARAAATEGGWRWWTPGVAELHSDWCYETTPPRPAGDETGWMRIVVSGEVFGPLASLWPNRWDKVYTAAEGPAILVPPGQAGPSTRPPAELPVC